MTTSLVSFATTEFEKYQHDLSRTAKTLGVQRIFEYTKERDLLSTPFYRENMDLLDVPKGAGYWVWKPYFILQALKQLKEGDILLYADAGTSFLSSFKPLVNLCQADSNGILLFDMRPLLNREWTKRDCFILLGADESRYWDAYQAMATVIVLKKSDFVVGFIQEWLKCCLVPLAVTSDASLLGPEFKEFIEHRWDQSILSILGIKYNLNTYRSPAKWGNYLKFPQFRRRNEYKGYPYALKDTIQDYAVEPQLNSPYGTIFEFNKRAQDLGHQPLTSDSSPKIFPLKHLVKYIAHTVAKISQRAGFKDER